MKYAFDYLTVKKYVIILLVFVSQFTFSSLHAQHTISMVKNELIGNWKVTNALNKENMNGISSCNMGSEFKITAESISFNDDKGSYTVPYKWEMEREIYRFSRDKTDYEFQLYFADKYFILQEKSGCLLLLEKK